MEKVKILTPIKGARVDTGKERNKGTGEKKHGYGLIITDALNIEHYFDYDGTYDGWSVNVPPDGSCPLPNMIEKFNSN